jgi:hypothetical protein
MTEAQVRQKVKDKLASDELPQSKGSALIIAAAGGSGQTCSACDEVIKPSDVTPIAYDYVSGTRHWFHVLCEKIWEEELSKTKPRP